MEDVYGKEEYAKTALVTKGQEATKGAIEKILKITQEPQTLIKIRVEKELPSDFKKTLAYIQKSLDKTFTRNREEFEEMSTQTNLTILTKAQKLIEEGRIV